MKRSKRGVKICRKDYLVEKLVSCFNDGKVVEYKLNKWTKRPKKCGPLAVFDSIESARFFINPKGENKLFFRCKYKESGENVLYKPYKTCNYAPDDTIFADKVKILEEIK